MNRCRELCCSSFFSFFFLLSCGRELNFGALCLCFWLVLISVSLRTFVYRVAEFITLYQSEFAMTEDSFMELYWCLGFCF
jgi:hypothetical protein